MQLDDENEVTLLQALDFGTRKYVIAMELYLYYTSYDSCLFCIPIETEIDNNTDTKQVHW